jgi:Hydrazine synthase alpha subunit middle domain
MNRQMTWGALSLSAAVLVLGLAACGKGSDSVVVEGDVPVAYVKRANSIRMNPTNGAPFAAGGDLLLREKSSPSAAEHNVTAAFTRSAAGVPNGDVSDPEVSYDGKKIIFSMRCPAANPATIAGQPACTGHWNIWEYDMSSGGMTAGTFRRLTATTTDDDVDPAYLPGDRGFVFSSNRQTKSKVNQSLGQTYYALDEYERERVFNLHTMDAQGGNIQQISFNQSHDRNPVVKSNGDIMFSRWEHVGPRNRFAIFTARPDGTNMFVFYGAQSPGNSFLHPREMDPKGAYKGFLTSSLMSLSGTQEGGALMLIDSANYSEYRTPANPSVPVDGGQKQITAKALNDGRGLSEDGRVTTPYPLWDGTDRVLVSFRTCEVTKNGVIVPCASLSQAEKDSLAEEDMMAGSTAAVQDNVPAQYAIYMFDPKAQTWLPIATPPAGFMYTDPVALQSRAEPNATEPVLVDEDLKARDMALIEVRSVYDTDGLNRMGEGMLAAADLPAGCTVGIAKTAPTDPADTRAQVADLKRMKDPADAAYGCAPARFIRAIRAVAPPSNAMGVRSAIGETEFEQQQILGYAPIEPDGSFKLHVPADIPLALAVVDAKGRGIQTHLNWIQVRPGERRTCDGCHSPRRGAALNSGDVVNSTPAGAVDALSGANHQSGETMAATRTRLNPANLNLVPDMEFTDVWADPAKGGVARPAISMKYRGNANPADDLDAAMTPPVNGIINYASHIQPLWTRSRGTNGANTCTNCHADPAKLDLRANVSGTGRLVSYEELMLGDPVIGANGLPVTRIEDGVPVIVRGAALVEPMVGNAGGIARASRLTEIMFGENLKSDDGARTTHPNPPNTAPDHATLLNAAEKRLMVEWMDLGGQYANNPFDGGVQKVANLSQTTFEAQVLPVLRASCMDGCHLALGSNGASAGTSFLRNRFVLTGDVEGDYGVTLSMISNTCVASSNYLLSRPSTVPHPGGATTQTTAVLPTGSAGYTAIANWIGTGCPTP